MFTGIVEAVGTVRALEPRGGDVRIALDTGALEMAGVQPGDSVAVNGVCLTAVAPGSDGFEADASRETLSLTTLGRLRVGDRVNLETALRAGEPLGGHLVSGHVDGLGEVRTLRRDARSWRIDFALPPELARYVARKGSICIDGVSLTVNDVADDGFGVNIVPHTWQATIIADYQAGRAVNIEVDLVARYLERLLAAGGRAALDEAGLRELGYGTDAD